MNNLTSSLKTLFFLLILGFPFSRAVGQTCATPGLAETQAGIDANAIGCIENPTGCNEWENDGNAILTTYRVVETNAIVTKIGIFVGSGAADLKVCLYDNVDGQTEPGSLLSHPNPNQFDPPIGGFGGQIASYEVSLDTPIAVSAGDTLWSGVKFEGNASHNLIYQPDAEGVVGGIANAYAANFPNTINSGALGTLPGSFGIYLILEDCVIPGCTDNTACNYNVDATEDDGSCTYPDLFYDCDGACLNDTDGDGVCDELEIAGCTDPNSCEYNPLATNENDTCVNYPGDTCDDGNIWSMNDVVDDNCVCVGVPADTDGDGLTDQEEVEVYGTDPNLQDSDGDGMTDAAEVDYGYDPLLADSNSDGCGDLQDLAGDCDDNSFCAGDLNNDEQVNSGDLLLFLGLFGSNCSE